MLIHSGKMQTAKVLINSVLKQAGYRLEPETAFVESKAVLYEKYLSVIRETATLYKETVLSTLPALDEKHFFLLSQLLGTQLGEALYILNSVHQSLGVEGDICEFGIAQGSTSTLLSYCIKNTDKNIWLFDSFEGLPKPTEKDLLKDDIFNLGTMAAYQGTMSCKADLVISRLNGIQFPLSRAKIVPGFIEETIHQSNLPKNVSFAYVDFDFYQPILIALEFLHHTLSLGGWIVVDDYDFFSTGAKTAVDEFLQAHRGIYEFSLPTPGAGHFCLLKKIQAVT